MLLRLIIVIAMLAPLGFHAEAQELPEHFYPVRPFGMGGAFTAIANDENALWTNPAGAARIRKARSRESLHLIKLPNLVMGANTKSREFIQGIAKKGNEANIDKIVDRAEELGKRPFWSVFGAAPMVMFDMADIPSALAIYSNTTLKSVVDSQERNTARTEAISDVGGLFNFTFTSESNQFNFGINLRYLARYAYEDDIPIEDFARPNVLRGRIKSGSNKTMAMAVDAGILYTFSDFWFPTLGLSILNLPTSCKKDYLNPFSKVRETVCGTKFSGDIGNADAISILDPTNIRVGFAITPRLTRKLAARISLDLQHLGFSSGNKHYGLSEVPFQKLVHAGAEFFVGNPLLPAPVSFAIGMSQGYYTAGVSLRLGYLSLDFSTFGRDISTDSKPVQDRRFMGGISIDI